MDWSSSNVSADWSSYSPPSTSDYIVRRKTVAGDQSFDGSQVIGGVSDPTQTYDDQVLDNDQDYDYVVLRKTNTEDLFFYHTDHLGTPIAMTDSGENPRWRVEHRPFGDIEEYYDYSPIGVVSNLRFPGQYFDSETGLHQNYFRTYDPSTARYREPDPLGESDPTEGRLFESYDLAGRSRAALHLYSYAANNPTLFIDAWGLACSPSDYDRDLVRITNILVNAQEYNWFRQLRTQQLFSGENGCGKNADHLVDLLSKSLQCYSAERIDFGYKAFWPDAFVGYRRLPHSFVKLTPIDACEGCLVRPPALAVDNYFKVPRITPFIFGNFWSPI